ncbi:MAG: caspase family protein [Kofleriaceae bacterium]|nr:caspase family protein [Kofleriaceae bacterium]
MVRLACVIAVLLMASVAFAEQRYAVVIGSNPGWSQDRPLRYAEHDAERMRDVLVALGNFPSDRVMLMRDPSTAEVRSALRKLASTARDSSAEDTLVFVYYSGHADDKFLHLRGDPLTHRELQDTLRALPATIKLGVVDACKSGAVTRKGGAPVEEFAIDVVQPKLSGMVLLSSSGADELSQESRALAGSVFTHHLVSGLRGAADANGDKQITISEAYQYAYGRTSAATAASNVKQRPAFRYELSGQGELVLTSLKANRSVAVVVPRGAPQKYVVLDQNEWRLIAEATAESARDVMLALAPGAYKVKRMLEDRLEVGTLVVTAGQQPDLGRIAFQQAPLSAGIVKGDPAQLAPPERREWERAEALRMLAEGQAQAALVLFDQLLREDPRDLLSWRGRGRALVRLAEAYQRVNDSQMEKRALGDALRADPSLSEDPMFAIWYQRLGEIDARDKAVDKRKQDLLRDVARNPRTVKSFGVGVDIVSGRGAFAVSGTKLLNRMVFATAAIDVAGPGLDLGVTLVPMASRWSPFIGIAGHLSTKKLGWDPWSGGELMSADGGYSSDEIWGVHGRVEGGMQFASEAGFTTDLGLTLILFKTDEGKITQQLWPVIHLGWLW